MTALESGSTNWKKKRKSLQPSTCVASKSSVGMVDWMNVRVTTI